MTPSKWLIILVFLSLGFEYEIFGQVRILQFSKKEPVELDMKEIQNIVIDSRSDRPCVLVIQCKIKADSGNVILSYDFPVMAVTNGMHVCNYLDIDPEKLFQKIQ
jgi:hypothetical protein